MLGGVRTERGVYVMREIRAVRHVPFLALMIAGCGGSTAVDGNGGGGGGGTAGSSATGGAGLEPIDPGGPMPNCAADEPSIVPVKERRWLAIDGKESADGPVGRYLVEITPEGPASLTRVAESHDTKPGSWSADGRFFAFPRFDDVDWVSIEVLDVSQGAPPVPVDVPHRPGFVNWSPTDARFYVLSSQDSNGPVILSLVDVTSATEKVLEISEPPTFDVWSPDGRYIALSGSSGVTLIDTSGAALVAISVGDGGYGGVPDWSPGSRHLAFASNGDVAYYDIEAETVEVVSPRGFFSSWLGDGLLGWIAGSRGYFLDVTQKPLAPVALRGEQRTIGRVSPGGKCLLYDGYCGHQVSESGLCVRTLPPVLMETPVRIHDTGNIVAHWAGTGDHLVFRPPTTEDVALLQVTLDGGEFTREPILEGSVYLEPTVLWNPSGQADWLSYLVRSPSTNDRIDQRLWHRVTGQTFVVDVGDRSSQRSSWSPDGRYLALEVGAVGGDQEAVLQVQEVLEEGLGTTWTIEGVFSAQDLWEQPWQP